ncbi:MAG: aldehyde dehydrogenase family protein [Candidatus Spechtbacteria bacterium]|nr:aldehyde dehydrogenase family protein [Candidatus Spechtbacteria bacterium]
MRKQSKHPFGFVNEPMLDFSQLETRLAIDESLREVHDLYGKIYPLILGTEEMTTRELFLRPNPSFLNERVGYVCMGGKEDVDRAIRLAHRGQPLWGAKTMRERGDILLRAAELMRQKRMFFIALMMIEVGKGRGDADGEVAEAIEFLDYYGRCAPWLQHIAQSTVVQVAGEENTWEYLPLGVGASIQPWNFPLSLSVGPTAAALVMGNAVIYKPASHSAITGYYMVKLLREAGVPPDALHYLPCPGSTVGNYLISHFGIDFVAFTGSEEVGNDMEYAFALCNNNTRALPPHQQHKKKVAVIEMGGKGFIIVDSDADIDEAVVGVSNSAFSFQGQKCSACTRVIVIDDVYDEFVRRLSERVASITIGSPENAKNMMGPMVSREHYDNVRKYMELAEREGTVLARGTVSEELKNQGYFLPPMLVGNVHKDARIAQEEIFGPVLAVFRAKTFAEAIDLANYTKYGLTGGVYSRDPQHLALARQALQVGNLYINRKITGAVVGCQPFGGMKMSGNGTKAGGWDYLLNFATRKAICENTVRRGVAVK